MQASGDTNQISSISLLLIVQVGAFVVFHFSMALVFELEWVKLTLKFDLLATLNWLVRMASLYVPIFVLAWGAFHIQGHRALLLATAIGTIFSAYYWQYPMMTGFLYLLGQFDRFPEFLFGNMPGIDQYPAL
jgi:hypothetical protein